jgi:hypothetical protein
MGASDLMPRFAGDSFPGLGKCAVVKNVFL